jgi:hypothetical protein
VTTPRPKKKSLFRRAFANQYNGILLAGIGLFSLATFSWLPLLVGAGIEALWLTLGPDTPFFRRWVEAQETAEQRDRYAAQAAAAIHGLERGYVARFKELEGLAAEISTLAEENASLETALIQDEMKKLGSLLSSWLQMAAVHQRLGRHIGDNSETEIQREINQLERALAGEKNREVQASLRQNLALEQKRMKQHQQIAATFKVITIKMDTLEKAFRYLRTHILAISKREELSSELDELVIGVDSVEALDAETDPQLDDDLRRARAAAAAKQKTR